MTDVDYDDLIKDDKERKALEKYNINNEMDISSVGRQRFPAKSNQEEENLLCRCEGHMKMRCSEKCTSTNWWREHRCVNSKRVPDRQQPNSVAWWSSEGTWLRGMNSGHYQERLTTRQIRDRDMGPVHRVWYK